MRKLIAIIVLNFLTLGLYGQQCTIEGITWDSIYIGTSNKIKLEGFDCNNLHYKIEPSISIEKEGCTLNIIPIKPFVNYKLTVFEEKKTPFVIELHSAIVTLRLACLTTNGLVKDNSKISFGVAKTIIGLKPIVNCPWLHEAVSIVAYTFFVERKGTRIFTEETFNGKLSAKALIFLQNVSQGDIIVFDDIKVRHPGESQSIYRYIKLFVK